MLAHGAPGLGHVARGVALAQGQRRLVAHAVGDVAVQGVVGARLVGDEVGNDTAPEELGQDVCRVSEQADGQRPAVVLRLPGEGEGLVEARALPVEVLRLQPPLDPVRIDLHGQDHAVVHGGGEGLGAAHAAEARGEDQPALEAPPEVLARRFRKGLVGALQDALGADVDPGARGHLAVHHQALAIELVEVVPGGPVGHQHRVGDQHPRRVLVGLEDPHRLARLHEEGLVVAEGAQLAHDGVEAFPVARRLADATVDHEVLRPLGDLGVEVVHEHAQGRLLLPGAAGERRPARGAYDPGGRQGARGAHISHRCPSVVRSFARS